MFWDSVLAGLKVLTYWETYVAGLEYLAIFFIPMAIAGTVMDKGKEGIFVGCLGMLLLPVLQIAAMIVMILTLSPIIFGLGEDVAWSYPWQLVILAPSVFLKLVGVLIVCTLVLAFIPIFGQLQSLQTLVLGGITLKFVLGMLDSAYPGITVGVNFVPGFWFSVGLLVVGGIMSWVGIMVASLALSIIALPLQMANEGLAQLLMFPIGAIFGFIPLFMYGAWLGSQISSGF